MKSLTIKHFAGELGMSPQVLLDLFKSANVAKATFKDRISDVDKAQLLDYLRIGRVSAEAVRPRKLTRRVPHQHELPLIRRV